ncbi:MAG: exodeoxyribonuclease VII large subunit [Alcanivoracaceae bacterium]|nr:exodeoxyribonuclease VII large subunit [Alcanivoracaceae bacterium]
MIPSNIGKSPENSTTPSVLNNLARKAIEMQLGNLWLRGEVTDLYMAPSGHAYFSLKDNKSSIKCTFFKQYNFKRTVIKNGDSLLVLGLATLYEERGTFQLKVERVETSGIGDMAKAFAELKVKLEALGYFSPEKKQPIPSIINSLGIVTSKSSAAITDVLNVIKRRNPLLEVKIYHASVQGDKAVEEIIDALLRADINQHDVILLTRGGGSEEDLWTFNDVSIAQTLFNLSTICVSAIGHERDTSISDLVADISAITPTAAAELLTPDLSKLSLRISHNKKTIEKLIVSQLNNYNQQLDIIYHKLEKSHPKNSINNEKQKINNRYQRLKQLIQHNMQARNNNLALKQNNLKHFDFKVDTKKFDINIKVNKISNLISTKFTHKSSKLNSLAQHLNTLSPLATLSRGYSITLKHKTKTIISHFDQVNIGEEIETIVDSGKIISKVTEINETIK